MGDLYNSLSVAETFYSIQGEGQTAGRPSYFLRLAACNLMCGGWNTEKDKKLHDGATWRCDTIEVWRKGRNYIFPELVQLMGGDTFIKDLKENSVHLVITGGEPMLQQLRISKFLMYLWDTYFCDPWTEIETNGTIMPDQFLLKHIQFWNCSPKLSNSGMELEDRIKLNVLSAIADKGTRTMFKFVVSRPEDIVEIENLLTEIPLIRKSQIWLMPGADEDIKLNWLGGIVAELAKENRFNYSNRLHIQLWNRKTGV